MKTILNVVAPTTVLYILEYGQLNGSVIAATDLYINVGTTSSLIYVPLGTIKVTVDMQGIITVYDLTCSLQTNNSANGVCKLQISGDGGNTFTDITNDILGGVRTRGGVALWINSIQAGIDKLQVRVLGRSSNGNLATIKIYTRSTIQMTLNKRLS